MGSRAQVKGSSQEKSQRVVSQGLRNKTPMVDYKYRVDSLLKSLVGVGVDKGCLFEPKICLDVKLL